MGRLDELGPFRLGNVHITLHKPTTAAMLAADPDWQHVHSAEGLE